MRSERLGMVAYLMVSAWIRIRSYTCRDVENINRLASIELSLRLLAIGIAVRRAIEDVKASSGSAWRPMIPDFLSRTQLLPDTFIYIYIYIYIFYYCFPKVPSSSIPSQGMTCPQDPKIYMACSPTVSVQVASGMGPFTGHYRQVLGDLSISTIACIFPMISFDHCSED